MTQLVFALCVALLLMGSVTCVGQGDISPPEVFLQGHDEHSVVRYSNPVQLPDGTLVRYSVDGDSDRLVSHASEDVGRTWRQLRVECDLLPRTYMVLPLLDRDGEIHLVSMVGRGEGEMAVTRFIDVWHQRTTSLRTTWEEPNLIYEGYCGALLDFKQLSSGRLVVPFAWWVPERPMAPPIGANLCTVFSSDDGGLTWLKSPSDLCAREVPKLICQAPQALKSGLCPLDFAQLLHDPPVMFCYVLLLLLPPLAALIDRPTLDDRDREILAFRQQVLILQRQLGWPRRLQPSPDVPSIASFERRGARTGSRQPGSQLLSAGTSSHRFPVHAISTFGNWLGSFV